MTRRFAVLVVGLVLGGRAAVADATTVRFGPGAPGIGDPYFPLDGNGGYDVAHYDLDIRYEPATDMLRGVATITATATQDLSSFNLDLDGLTVRSISVNGRSARWSRNGGELTITPRERAAQARGVHDRDRLRRRPADDRRRRDRALRLHPHRRRRARRRPAGRGRELVPGQRPPARQGVVHLPDHGAARAQAIANGVLRGRDDRGAGRRGRGTRASRWRPTSRPRRSASSTSSAYRADGIRLLDAIDPDLFDVAAAAQRASSSRSRRSASRRTSGWRGRSPSRAVARELSFWITA